MLHALKTMSLKTMISLGTSLGSLGFLAGSTQEANAQKSRNLIKTELGVQNYRIPSLGINSTIMVGRASMAFNADNDKAFQISPMVAANYTYGINTYKYNYNYSNPYSAGFGAGAGYITRTTGVNVEMGVQALARVGVFDIHASAAGQAPVWFNGTSGLGGNIRAGFDLNLKQITNDKDQTKGTLYLGLHSVLGLQRTLRKDQNFNTKFHDVGFEPFTMNGITVGLRF
jgi:hypothetical protein